MGQPRQIKQLAKFLDYILARSPYEFGLVPDENGYFRIKDLLKVFSEEQGWKHVRQSHLNEIMISLPNAPVEITGDRIRSTCRNHPGFANPAGHLPKLLYTCVRRKAYPFVLDKGISPMGSRDHVILTPDADMAVRIGRRIDPDPVLLTIQTAMCQNQGICFQQAAELIFLTRTIPSACFTGPPLTRFRPEEKKKEPVQAPVSDHLPGSFFINFGIEKPDKLSVKRSKKQTDITRKKQRDQMRRHKQNPWPD